MEKVLFYPCIFQTMQNANLFQPHASVVKGTMEAKTMSQETALKRIHFKDDVYQS